MIRFAHSYRRAFTLIELSIVLVFVSLIVSFGMQAVQTTGATDCYAVTRKQMTEINNAFTRYLSRNSGTGQVALPTPASRALGITDPNYGKSLALASITGTADTDGAVIKTFNSVEYLFGALPFSTLGLPSSYAADCWGNKFTYAVTKTLTVAGTSAGQYSDINSRGTIIINTGTLGAPKTVYTQAGYVVISHGVDGATKGAAPRSGSKSWCTVNTNDPPDKENCDIANAIFYSAPFNSGSASTAYFDDIVVYGSKGGPTGMAGVNNGAGGIGASCVAGTVTWGAGACSASVGSTLLSGQTTNVVDASPTGSATVTCTNGVLVATGACGTPCAGGGTLSWGSGNCSYGPAPAMEGGTTAGPFMNTASGFTGTATTVTCDVNGNMSVTSGNCAANCPAASHSWSQSGNNCSGTSAEVNGDGSTGIVANTAAGLTGQGTFTCTNGVASATSGTCAPASGKCPAGTVAQWGSGNNCQYVVASETPDGWSLASVASTTSGYTGSATITCNGSTGQYTITNATCGQDCQGINIVGVNNATQCANCDTLDSISNRCGYNVPSLKFGTSIQIPSNPAISNGATQYGSATFTCESTGSVVSPNPTATNRQCTDTNLAARCWGGNNFGQVGDGTNTTSNGAGLTRNAEGVTRYSQIVASRSYTCAISNTAGATNGLAYCWGGNINGEFGINPTTSAAYAVGTSFNLPQRLSLPTDGVTAATSITQLAPSEGMLCAIDNLSRAWCQGRNQYGALGNNTAANTDSATNVSNGWQRVHTVASNGDSVTNFSAIATDWFHTCGISSTGSTVVGRVYCWGDNSAGQLGNGSLTSSIIPVPISTVAGNTTYFEIATLGETLSGPPEASISATCATVASGANVGKVFCWGDNSRGQLGNSSNANVPAQSVSMTTADSATPVAVKLRIADVQAIPNAIPAPTFNQQGLSNSTNFFGLRGGGNRACVLGSTASYTPPGTIPASGTLYCWGDNTNGALGNFYSTDDDNYDRDILQAASAQNCIRRGSSTDCVVATGPNITTYTARGFSSLPVAFAVPSATVSAAAAPANNASTISYSQVATGGTTTCARTNELTYCAGGNANGQVGNNAASSLNASTILRPTSVNLSSSLNRIAAVQAAFAPSGLSTPSSRSLAISASGGCIIGLGTSNYGSCAGSVFASPCNIAP